QTMGLAPSAVTAEVRQGEVVLSGSVEFKSLVPVIERLCRSVDGVVSVAEHLAYRTDDVPISPDGT
ncbi:BON domain-containing protein, partial [Streptomyces sp. NPDC056255]|uniref:BON domain-containing protein n=1 Tax=Streptomyces sp. NPDC056255 TaxID=3345764 RepID=UPI0035E14A2D